MLQNTFSTKQYILIIFFALVSTLALFTNATIPPEDWVNGIVGEGPYIFQGFLQLLAKIRWILPSNLLATSVVLVGLVIYYFYYFLLYNENKTPKSKIFFALSLLFSLFTLVGISFYQLNSADFLIQNKFQMLYSFILFIGFTAFFYVSLEFIVYAINTKVNISVIFSNKLNKIIDFILEKRPVLIPSCLMLLCWMPYLIVCYPGSINWDMIWELKQFYKINPMNTHHPLFATLVYGMIHRLSNIIFHQSFSVFACVLIQSIFLISSLTYEIYTMRKWGVSKIIRFGVFLFFSLNPLYPLWTQILFKDIFYCSFFVFFSVSLLKLLKQILEKQSIYKVACQTIIWGVLLSLFRNNGVYIAVASLFVLIGLGKNKRQKWIISLFSIITAILVSSINSGLFHFYQAEKGSIAETLSIPFQQTARYVRDHPDEVTEEERIAIDSVLDYNALATAYNPELSDPVKGTFKKGGNLSDYFKVWFKMFWKHPAVYFQATINNIYAYFSPSTPAPIDSFVIVDMTEFILPRPETIFIEPEGGPHRPVIFEGLLYYPSVFSEQARKACANIVYSLRQTPGIGLLWNIGTYTWIVLFLSALALYQKKYYLIIGCVPTFMNILCCVASPVNGFTRYALPHMLAMPILIGWFIVNYKNKTNESTQKEEKKCKTKKKKLQS